MKKHLALFVVALFIAACNNNNNEEPGPVVGMDQLNIPEGFSFENTKDIEIEINMPASVDFSNYRSRFDLYTSLPSEGGVKFFSGSFDIDGQFKGEIRMPSSLEAFYVRTLAGSKIVELGTAGTKNGGVIIDFGDDYGYEAPDTTEQKSIPVSNLLTETMENTFLSGRSNVIGNGDFETNDFGSIPYWNSAIPVDEKWYFTNYYYYGSMSWMNNEGNGIVATPLNHSYYYYYGGAVQRIEVEPGDVVSLSADIKRIGSLNSTMRSYLYLIPLNSSGNPIGYYNTYYLNPSTDWTNKIVTATMPSNAAYCTILLWNHDYASAGRIAYDNVVVIGPTTDTDGDGVDDDLDDYPNDAARAFDIWYPNENDFGCLAFEDNWPGKGDYDFNDMIVDYQFKQVVDANNGLKDLYGTFNYRAAGATLVNGLGIEIEANPSTIASVTGYSVNDGYISLSANGTEANQTNSVIILTDNIFTLLPHPGGGIGVNTTPGATYVESYTQNLTVLFSTAASRAVIGNPPFNPFMIVDQNRGREVHLINHTPTSLADAGYFGTEHDDSDPGSGSYYKTQNLLPWVIDIPATFAYPNEKVEIINAHLKFAAWAESGGSTFTDWYNDEVGYRNDGNIYSVPE